MKKRITIGNWIILVSIMIIMIMAVSCTQKVYNQRTSGINGKTGLDTAKKTQKIYENHE